MKTPRFWSRRGVLSTLLLPLATLYDMVSTLRRWRIQPIRLPIPVLCVGNVTAGGAGKTPVALHIGAWCKTQRIDAFFLSRGYGGSLRGPLRVDPARHSAAEVGDEPLLLARMLPTIISHSRRDGAALALAQGAKAIIMDDGFQNPSLLKHLSLLVVDGTIGLGNGRLLPAGPLRESWQRAVARASAVVVINPSEEAALPALPAGMPLLTARTLPSWLPPMGQAVVAFCGLGYPQKFFNLLEAQGVKVVATRCFADHHLYTARDLESLRALADTHQAQLVTTAKDAVRLTPAQRESVHIVDIGLVFEDVPMLETLLYATLKPAT